MTEQRFLLRLLYGQISDAGADRRNRDGEDGLLLKRRRICPVQNSVVAISCP